jgi:hypothetical protein
MGAKNVRILLLVLGGMVLACEPRIDERESFSMGTYLHADVDSAALTRQEKVYIPVYSDIYHMSGDKRFLLTVTASVRNTSMRDTMFVYSVDYYDSNGTRLRQYLNRSILLKPLESAEFIVEYLEKQGGAGANFIVDWGTNSPNLKPVIQGVMIGTLSQQGISFVTEGVTIQRRPEQPPVY